ncbi:MAG: DNA polymerase III subunit chi [bacterium]|nr:DNA polymerase III subunit chi [bacterium]
MSIKTDKPGKSNDAKGGPDILFYHLERAELLDILPSLLEKSLQRGWQAVVQARTDKQVLELNGGLWTTNEDSFLPHGAADDGFHDQQPIYLTQTNENPNSAVIRFFVGGAQPDDIEGYERVVYLFDGNDGEAVSEARKQWKRLAGEGFEATYWKQNERGGWEKKA